MNYWMDLPKTSDAAKCRVNTGPARCKCICISRGSGGYGRRQDGKVAYCHNPTPKPL